MTTPTVLNWLSDFAKGFAGQRPLYVNGVEIGYWTAEGNDLCHGNAFIYPEFLDANKQSIYPPSQWITKDDLWRDIPVSQYCVSKNIVPSWAQVNGSTVTLPPSSPGGQPTSLTVNPDQSISQPGTLFGLKLPSWATGIPIGVLLAGGGAVALLFLMKDRGEE